jgi:hypothetical protein
MNGELAPGTYRAANGDLIHCHDDLKGHAEIEIEHGDGSLSRGDVSVLRGAVRVSDDPLWPARPSRLVGIMRFD